MSRPPCSDMTLRAPRITKRQQNIIVRNFALDTDARQAAGNAKVSHNCAKRWYRYFREIIYESLRRAPRFGGEVEVDIGFFGGRKAKKTSAYVRRLAGLPEAKIISKRKEVERSERRKMMVLGILQRNGPVYLLPIRKKDRAMLEGAIRLVVERGSTIYSDMEKGLANLRLDTYLHETVNHSLEYARREGGKSIHINGMESFWRQARVAMGSKFRGLPRTTLMLHVKEREWRYNTDNIEKALRALLKNGSHI